MRQQHVQLDTLIRKIASAQSPIAKEVNVCRYIGLISTHARGGKHAPVVDQYNITRQVPGWCCEKIRE
jgi:hypothetical protein